MPYKWLARKWTLWGQPWTFSELEEPTDGKGRRVLGLWDPNSKQIGIDAGAPDVLAFWTFLHELGHRIEDVMGIEIADSRIDSVARVVWAFWIENPRQVLEIAKWANKRFGKA